MQFSDRRSVMARALELAAQGAGFVEPNPMVGAVLVDSNLQSLGEGWHRRFGGPHAEIEALRDAESHGHQQRLSDATLFVTLEPCCHFGKTPPCTKAILAAGIRKVIVGCSDPAPHVNGGGIAELRAAGVTVEVGLLESEARQLTAPFAKRVTTGLPFVIAKWAMSCDGKIATRTGDSQWISNEASRAIAHQLRGRMDAIIVGAETARRDDPLLIARPSGPRVATRVVVDSLASLALDSQLVRTVSRAPLLVVAGPDAPHDHVARLKAAGVEVCVLKAAPPTDTPPSSGTVSKISGTIRPHRQVNLRELLAELGRRGMTNVLVEGGGRILGTLADDGLIDELHVFVAPRLIGGQTAASPVAGRGVEALSQARRLDNASVEILNGDIYLHGRFQQPSTHA